MSNENVTNSGEYITAASQNTVDVSNVTFGGTSSLAPKNSALTQQMQDSMNPKFNNGLQNNNPSSSVSSTNNPSSSAAATNNASTSVSTTNNNSPYSGYTCVKINDALILMAKNMNEAREKLEAARTKYNKYYEDFKKHYLGKSEENNGIYYVKMIEKLDALSIMYSECETFLYFVYKGYEKMENDISSSLK